MTSIRPSNSIGGSGSLTASLRIKVHYVNCTFVCDFNIFVVSKYNYRYKYAFYEIMDPKLRVQDEIYKRFYL